MTPAAAVAGTARVLDTDVDYLTLDERDREHYLNILAGALARIDLGFSRGDVARELARSGRESVFGIPLSMTSDRVVIHLSRMAPWPRSRPPRAVAKDGSSSGRLSASSPGGIDLNPRLWGLGEDGDGPVSSADSPAAGEPAPVITGLVPVILQVTPVSEGPGW